MTDSKTIGPVLGVTLLVLSGLSAQALAQVEVNIGISVPPPPPLVIPAPPAVVLIPRTQVYLAPDIEMDLLFYRGWCPADRVAEGSEWI